MEYLTLNNGVKIPAAGFGVFRIEDADECEAVVLEAIRAGYRYIDTAAAYGNEEAVGRAIAKCGVPRSELFLSPPSCGSATPVTSLPKRLLSNLWKN